RSREQALKVAKRVLKPSTSIDMRYLMRLNAEKGTGTFANVPGYYVGGKTGTAEKVVNGRYSKHKLLTDFMAVLPADKPKYLVMIMLDEPQGLPSTHGFATAGWNVGPTAGKTTRVPLALLEEPWLAGRKILMLEPRRIATRSAALHMAGLATDRLQRPVQLSLDLRAQYAMRDELVKAREKFHAKAAAGLILNVNTGEVIAAVSEPDYDPNNPREANDPTRINRLTTGVYELGSTFKVLTVAMALDDGKATLHSKFDATHPLHYGRFYIHDYEPQHRFLSVPEIFTYSSNIGAARMALAVGVDGHKAFLKKMGQLDRLRTELPESAEPLVPKHWGELNTVTIAFGHGLSVAPLQAAMGIAACVNGGLLIKPT
ncbi:MAG: penicillin-binding transpeptidase domain-containing protein, partial [Pseudolabrys sp.]